MFLTLASTVYLWNCILHVAMSHLLWYYSVSCSIYSWQMNHLHHVVESLSILHTHIYTTHTHTTTSTSLALSEWFIHNIHLNCLISSNNATKLAICLSLYLCKAFAVHTFTSRIHACPSAVSLAATIVISYQYKSCVTSVRCHSPQSCVGMNDISIFYT